MGALTSNVRKRCETKKQQNTKLELKTILDTAQYYELGVNVNIEQNNMQNKRTYLIQQYTQSTRRKCNNAKYKHNTLTNITWTAPNTLPKHTYLSK